MSGRISDLILYKDHHLMAFNKPAGMPAQEDPSGDPSLHRLAMAYAHRDLYLVHRLDRRVSGVMVFAKTKQAATDLARQWDAQTVRKVYLAFVPLDERIDGTVELKHYLTYDKSTGRTLAHDQSVPGADEASLAFSVAARMEQYMLLRIELHTGRKHQIRAQLAAIGLPVKGDIRYGSKRTNPEGHIDLHAHALTFLHPSTQAQLRIVAPVSAAGLWTHIPGDILNTL
jgi:23S rRNA pseudouridine1911/1915/1917 synthase